MCGGDDWVGGWIGVGVGVGGWVHGDGGHAPTDTLAALNFDVIHGQGQTGILETLRGP